MRSKRKSLFKTDTYGIRRYFLEKDPGRADRIADYADDMLARGEPPAKVIALLRDHDDIFAAVIARMVRYARLFQVGSWDNCEEGDPVFLFCHLDDIPPAIRDAFEQQRREGSLSCKAAIRALHSPELESYAEFKYVVSAAPWILPSVFQEEFFVASSDWLKKAMINYLDELPRSIRIPFVTQVVLSEQVEKEWKLLCYCRRSPFRTRLHDEDLSEHQAMDKKVGVRLFGEDAWAYGDFCGLTDTYDQEGHWGDYRQSRSEYTDDYMFAVNHKVQEVYAESAFVRSLIARNRYPGYELTRASFEDFAGAAPECRLTSRDRDFIVQNTSSGIPEQFLMMCDMSGVSFSRGMLRRLVADRKSEVLVELISVRPEDVEAVMSFEELSLYFAACGYHEIACPVLRAVESVRPGSIARAVDSRGNNALMYVLMEYAHRLRAEDPAGDPYSVPQGADDFSDRREELVDLLVSIGCDTDQRNHLGFSFSEIRAYGGDV